MKYRLDRNNGTDPQFASSKKHAIRLAKEWIGVNRVYRGAEYQTDRLSENGERQSVFALDIWSNKLNASQQMNTCADVVISW